MSSREKILNQVKQHQPTGFELPEDYRYYPTIQNTVDYFTTVLKNIGGQVYLVSNHQAIIDNIRQHYSTGRIVTNMGWNEFETIDTSVEPQSLQNVSLTILTSKLGVAENGALWLDDSVCPVRALPFISENLDVVIEAKNIVNTMHEAYNQLQGNTYGFGTFIAGPSKTADIEQSLVLGAHGSRSMQVFILH